jgi:hypothetical protein
LEEHGMKGKLRVLSIGLMAGATAAGGARAGEMFSARLSAQEGQSLSCAAVNVGRKDVQMHVELFESGEYDGTPGSPGTSLPPGGSTSTSSPGPRNAFCRLTYSGNKKNVRAAIEVSESNVVTAVLPLQ